MKTIFQEVIDASIKLYPDNTGAEDFRFLDGVNSRVRRFNHIIRVTFQLPKFAEELRAAHLACFHIVPPSELNAALQGQSYWLGDRAYLDWTSPIDEVPQRRALCPLTLTQANFSDLKPNIEWSSFCKWILTVEGFYDLSIEDALEQLRLDQIAWSARKLPPPLFAHAIGLRPMRPLSRVTLARQMNDKVAPSDVDERTIERETQVSELIDSADEAQSLEFSHHDIALIERAIKVLKTSQDETSEQHIDRWVRGLIALQNSAHLASIYGLSILAWMTDLCESGTVSKADADHVTRARYLRNSALLLLRMCSQFNWDPSNWKEDELERGCIALMSDIAARDKVGLGGGIASFLQFFHETRGAPLPKIGIHKLIPPPHPRAQFVSETEILRAVNWTTEQTGADEHMMKIVRVCLALGWSAPFRIQELLYLRLENVLPLDGGGYEIEIVPRRGSKLKTDAAERRVKIPQGWCSVLLKEWLDLRKHQTASSKACLFGTDDEPNSVYRHHAVRTTILHLLKATTGDLSMTFHSLRHSWATTRVAEILASSRISDFDRFIHVAYAMGHVSPATTLYFYSHQAEDALGMHMNSLLRDILGMNSSDAMRLLGKAPGTVRQHGLRNFGWDAETSLWQSICSASQTVFLPDCAAGMDLVAPTRPILGKGFIRDLSPTTVLTILRHLNEDRLSVKQIAAVCRVTDPIVEKVRSHAIGLAQEWLNLNRRRGERLTRIESVSGATAEMGINLLTAFKEKYRNLRINFSVAMDLPLELIDSWFAMRNGIYLSATPSSSLQTLLRLFQSAGLKADEFKVVYQSAPANPYAALQLKAEVALQFRTIWNVNPEFIQRGFCHEARPNAYLVFPGEGRHNSVETSSFSSVKGLDAILYATCVYVRLKRVN